MCCLTILPQCEHVICSFFDLHIVDSIKEIYDYVLPQSINSSTKFHMKLDMQTSKKNPKLFRITSKYEQ
jgi:hypothetical protein